MFLKKKHPIYLFLVDKKFTFSFELILLPNCCLWYPHFLDLNTFMLNILYLSMQFSWESPENCEKMIIIFNK